MKTHADFLEELKEALEYTVKYYQDKTSDFQRGKIDAYESILRDIEQFEAELKCK